MRGLIGGNYLTCVAVCQVSFEIAIHRLATPNLQAEENAQHTIRLLLHKMEWLRRSRIDIQTQQIRSRVMANSINH